MGPLIRLPMQRRAGAKAPAAPRAVIVSASVGAGHDAVAAELAARLEEAGVAVDRHDFLDLLPGPAGGILVGSYHRMLDRAPWSWKLLYGSLDNHRMMSMQASLFTALAGRAMRRAVADDDVRIVVSTYPLASQVLGRLRRRGTVDKTVHTYLTDFSVHRLWASPDVDAHLAVNPIPAEQARGIGCKDVSVIAPLVDRRFTPVTDRLRYAARARWGLPQDARLALLVGGSWGAGEIERTVNDVEAADPGLTCLVVCGRNEPLRERLLAAGVRHAFGWVDDMPSLMHAADVLVQNAGGMTVQEAVASGLPVVTYRSIPGHGLTNAAALDEAGVARWVRHQGDLAEALAEAQAGAAAGAAAGSGPDDPSVLPLPAREAARVLLEAAGIPYPAAAPAAGAASGAVAHLATAAARPGAGAASAVPAAAAAAAPVAMGGVR
ncbi:MGDG synthase family glycosyltransferase [Streptacidiphilus cavernicola]|uniref:Glycosyltransferase n=1 Tax=Streptacidiphilus cavernicola TaxID=3342716 RepID=A0ABV6W3L1_9ACTN